MDGIIIIDKPKGITSHDVVFKLRKILHTKKIGHTGTLDPIATGVLPICIGNCTKASKFLICDDKIYKAQIKLGILTDTSDITGKILEEKNVKVDKEEIENTIKTFIGKQIQKPPIYSAVKVNGKKLYEYAREGKEIEIPTRQIEIYNIEIDNIDLENNIIDITVHCSKGTYIRSLCVDIGEKLGTVATMNELRRIKSGKFTIDQSVRIQELEESLENIKIMSLEDVFSENKKIVLSTNDSKKLINGVLLNINLEDGLYRIYEGNKFLGIATLEGNKLKREIIL